MRCWLVGASARFGRRTEANGSKTPPTQCLQAGPATSLKRTSLPFGMNHYCGQMDAGSMYTSMAIFQMMIGARQTRSSIPSRYRISARRLLLTCRNQLLFCSVRLGGHASGQREMGWMTRGSPGGGTLVVRLNNELGNCVGKLQLHNHAQRAQLRASSDGRELGAEVEVVAINAERSYKLSWKGEEKRRGHPIQVQDSYTILWVEWEGGVAYRKAVGWIAKPIWEQLDLKDVNLVLG